MGIISNKLEQEGFEIKDLIRWIKPAPMPRNVNRRYVTDFEFAVWATKKGSKWTFNKPKDKPYLIPKYNSSVPMGNNRIHPTQKPEKLIDEIISVHSNPGDLIFDPFSGSGTISFSANKNNRNYIACEIDEKFCQKSINRIKSYYIRPAFNHLGNKTRIIHDLISNFPKNNIVNFVEPFAGSGIVSISYDTPDKYWLNDNDSKLSEILEYLLNNKVNNVINDIEKIIKDYNLPTTEKKNYSKEYKKLKDDYNKSKKVSLLFVLVLYGFNQQIRFNSKNEFNIPVGKFFWNDYHKDKIINFISKRANKNIETQSRDFEEFVYEIKRKYANQDNTLFYFDPPYFLSNATYNSCWKEEDEKRLINCLQKLTDEGYKWCLSNIIESKGRKNELLENFITKNKSKINFQNINNLNYHNSNYQRQQRNKKDVEVIVWGNYE